MKFKFFLERKEDFEQDNDVKYQALTIAKNVHTRLAKLSFIDMLYLMNSDNPAKSEIKEIEAELNQLTNKVGAFIEKHFHNISKTLNNEEKSEDKLKD